MNRHRRGKRATRPMPSVPSLPAVPPLHGSLEMSGSAVPVARAGVASGNAGPLAAHGNTPGAIPAIVETRPATARSRTHPSTHKGFRTLLRNPQFLRL